MYKTVSVQGRLLFGCTKHAARCGVCYENVCPFVSWSR